jgi:3',5'-cyclic AMP phosphodiesterase CpdA
VIRLAHFSDIHVTRPPHAEPWKLLANKRLMGALNYYLGGRGRHFHQVEERIARLLEDIEGQQVDHALCTGDVTALALESEFDACGELFGRRLSLPERWTVIPGNHDRYLGAAVADAFERRFAPLCEGAKFPFVKRLGDRVSLVAIDGARATGWTDSSGWIGPTQRDALRELLASPDLKGHFVVVALHYGLLRASGRPDRPRHGLRDWAEVLAILDAPELQVDLVLHGHLHRPFELRRGTVIRCAGSATDLAHDPGWDLYIIDPEQQRFEVQRRRWDPVARAYRELNADTTG